MTDSHSHAAHGSHGAATHAHAEHHGPTFQSYMIVFGILLVCTAISFIANAIFGIGNWRGVAIIMLVSICKATLVAMFFMHLKYDWMKLYFLVFPVVILTVMMVIVLLPDVVLDWHTGEPLTMPQSHGEHQ